MWEDLKEPITGLCGEDVGDKKAQLKCKAKKHFDIVSTMHAKEKLAVRGKNLKDILKGADKDEREKRLRKTACGKNADDECSEEELGKKKALFCKACDKKLSDLR